MSVQEQYMRRALDLAVMGAGTVSPNPMVGAVIVAEDRIVGEGYTSPYGGPHAEVNAVQDLIRSVGESQARELLKRSTVYVTLEPCAHYGKTPPCADMLVSYEVAKVVIGCLDPFAKVNGQGIAKLKVAGIEVVIGVLENECQFVNRRFFTRIGKFRPYVILKWAETNDGYFASKVNVQKWISNEASKQLVHKWRSEEDAILIGANTAAVDQPSLTTRLWKGKSPKRVLIDKNLSVSRENKIFQVEESELIIFNAIKSDWSQRLKLIELENFDLYLPQNILYQLYLMDVQSIIIEGGVKTLQMFIDAGLWDEARVFVGEDPWGDGLPAPRLQVQADNQTQVGSDQLNIFYNNYNN